MRKNGITTRSAPHEALQTVLRLSIIGILVLITLAGAFGLSANVPDSVAEGDTINVEFTGTGTLTVYLDGVQVISGTGTVVHGQPTDHTWAGTHEYVFSSSEEGNLTETVTVQDVPLTMSVSRPEDVATSSPVTFNVVTNWDASCSVTIDGTTYQMPDGTATQAVSEGVHDLMYACTLGSESAFEERTLLVDTEPPSVTTKSPSGTVEGPYITLSVETDEIARCRYGQQDLAYGQLPGHMSGQHVLRNTATLTLTEHGSYTYFIRCEDVHGNRMPTSGIISFLNTVAPTATIEVDEEQPLTSGTYELTLTTTTTLAETPRLSYRLEPSGTSRSVGLTGSGDTWTGYLTIPEDATDDVLTFSFMGETPEGVTGTQITKGGVVQIDAEAPDKVTDIHVQNTSGYVRLRWTFEDDHTFNIYRSADSGVSESDLHTTVGGTSYTDLSADGSRFYYYRIAAVDEAGNVGPLSDEVWGTVVGETETEQLVHTARIEDEILRITAALLTANRSVNYLEGQSNPSVQRAIDDLDLFSKAQEARVLLETKLRTLRELTRSGGTQQDVNRAIQQAADARQETKRHFIMRINPQSETEFVQPFDQEALARNVAYALTQFNAEKEQYLQHAIAVQERLTVRMRAHSVSLWDATGVEHKHTYVEKTISLDEPLNDVMLVEVIPKEVAASASDIAFTGSPVVLEDDPVVQYQFPVLERETFSYVVPGHISMGDVKRSRTLAFTQPPATTAPAVTGNATNVPTGSGALEVVLIIAAIVIVAGLAAYYFTLSQPEEPFHGLPAGFAPSQPVQAPKPRSRRRIVRRTLKREPSDPAVLIREAEDDIDRKQYESALSGYRKVIEAMDDDTVLHEVLGDDVHRVYRKLLLHKHLDDAHRALDEQEPNKVRKALEEARRTAKEVGEEDTPLVRDAQQAFSECAKRLNKLEIERIEY